MLKSYGITKNGIYSFGLVGFSFLNVTSYLLSQIGFIYLAETENVIDGKLYNTIAGRQNEYLTIGGSPGAETYTCPETQDYLEADMDYVWFKLNEERRTATKQDLVCWDFTRTFIKYDDEPTNDIRIIGILGKTKILTNEEIDLLFQIFELPIFWNDTYNDYGHEKNKEMIGLGLGLTAYRNLYIPEQLVEIIGAAIANSTPTKVEITFGENMDESSIPDVSTFTITGKTINQIQISATKVTLTITAAFGYGDVITVSYTMPGTNRLKSAAGMTVSTFVDLVVTNDIEYPAIFSDGNTTRWFDFTDVSTITKDGSNNISRVNHKLDNTKYIQPWNGAPAWSTDNGATFDGTNDGLRTTTNLAITGSFTVYLVMKVNTQTYNKHVLCFDESYITGIKYGATPDSVFLEDLSTSADKAGLGTSVFRIVRLRIDGVNSFIQINKLIASTGNWASYGISWLNIGSGPVNASTFAACSVRELIVRKVADSDDNMENIYAFLKSKHNL